MPAKRRRRDEERPHNKSGESLNHQILNRWAHAVPLEVGHLIRQSVDVRIVRVEDERFHELLEHADLQMGGDFRCQRWAHEPELLQPAEAAREMGEGGLPQRGDAAVEARIDGRRLFQDDGGRLAILMKEREPAAEARAQDGPAVRIVGAGRRCVPELNGLLEAVVEVVRDGEEDLGLAFEIEVEGAAGNAFSRDDVAAPAARYPRLANTVVAAARSCLRRTSGRRTTCRFGVTICID